jgi:TolA-binding protein
MIFNDAEKDDFDDEPQDVLPDEENDTADFDNESSEDENFPETEPEIIETHDDGDGDSDESNAYDRIAEVLGEDELEEVSSPLAPVTREVALLLPYERNNRAYADAVTAYYAEKNYQQAIEKFGEAIEDASQRTEYDMTQDDADDIIAKSMYWQAEACIKTQNVSQAIEIFKALVQNYQEHYLALAAQRRADQLNAKNS